MGEDVSWDGEPFDSFGEGGELSLALPKNASSDGTRKAEAGVDRVEMTIK